MKSVESIIAIRQTQKYQEPEQQPHHAGYVAVRLQPDRHLMPPSARIAVYRRIDAGRVSTADYDCRLHLASCPSFGFPWSG